MALGERSFKCLKYLLFSFNALFLLAGAGLIGAGVWIVVDSASFRERFSSFLNLDTAVYMAVAYVAIGIGGVVAIVSFLGCCGAITENKCLLRTFFIFILIWTILLIVVAVVAFVFSGYMKTFLEGPVKDIILNTYLPGVGITATYDQVQIDHSCCGFNGGSDYANSAYALTHSRENPWPASCCTDQNDLDPCLNTNPPSKSNSDRGCYEPISAILTSYIGIIGGVGFGMAALMIVSMVFTCCLISSIGKTKTKVTPWS